MSPIEFSPRGFLKSKLPVQELQVQANICEFQINETFDPKLITELNERIKNESGFGLQNAI